jgi:hypothetical protein
VRRFFFVVACIALAVRADAQSLELGVHLSSAKWSEFETNDTGIGGRLTWRPLPLLGIDADLTLYPSDFAGDTVAPFSGRRVEGMFGATIGPRLDRVRPFVKASAGFLDIGATPRAFVCVAIYPPPLACVLAGGRTLAAYEIGGGVQIYTPARTFIRADVTERFLNYPGPTFRNGLRELVDDDFFAGALRFTIGAGIRF